MPIENNIDCPALHKRSSSYPFGDRVPRTVRMLKTVTADPMPGIGLSYIKGNKPVAKAGQTYPVWTNSHGAVTAVMEDGTRLGLRPAEFEVESWHHLAAEPAPQHPEPIAWMVGTAFWWTIEEAERDAAETGLPIVGLGPMTDAAPAEQQKGEPVAWVRFRNGEPDYDGDACMIMNAPGDTIGDGDSWQPVYTHPAPADPGEVEQLRNELGEAKGEYDRSVNKVADLRAQLDERNAALECMTTTATSYKSELANRDALLQRMKTLFRTDDPFDLYDAVCNALAGKF